MTASVTESSSLTIIKFCDNNLDHNMCACHLIKKHNV